MVVGASSGLESMQSPRPAVGRSFGPLPVIPVKVPSLLGNAVKTDTIVTVEGAKLPSLGSIDWTKKMHSILAVLTKAGFDVKLVVDPFQDDEEYDRQEMLAESYFSGQQIFNLANDMVETVNPLDSVGYYKKPSIIWHILGVAMLMHGETTKTDFLRCLNREWMEVLDYVMALTCAKQAPAIRILDEILRKHVKETKEIHSKLMLCDDSIGFSNPRAVIVIDWVRRLKLDARKCWEENRTQSRLRRFKGHVASVKEITSDANSNARVVKDEFSNNEV